MESDLDVHLQCRILLKLEAGDAEEAAKQLEAYIDSAKESKRGEGPSSWHLKTSTADSGSQLVSDLKRLCIV